MAKIEAVSPPCVCRQFFKGPISTSHGEASVVQRLSILYAQCSKNSIVTPASCVPDLWTPLYNISPLTVRQCRNTYTDELTDLGTSPVHLNRRRGRHGYGFARQQWSGRQTSSSYVRSCHPLSLFPCFRLPLLQHASQGKPTPPHIFNNDHSIPYPKSLIINIYYSELKQIQRKSIVQALRWSNVDAALFQNRVNQCVGQNSW